MSQVQVHMDTARIKRHSLLQQSISVFHIHSFRITFEKYEKFEQIVTEIRSIQFSRPMHM